MTTIMHKFLIYLSIYFCLTCFGLSFSTSSEADVQLRQWFKSAGYRVSARALTPYPVDCALRWSLYIFKHTFTITQFQLQNFNLFTINT
jgi:hypothetical protein